MGGRTAGPTVDWSVVGTVWHLAEMKEWPWVVWRDERWVAVRALLSAD